MSPYLLFGFLFAGLLHVFVSLDWIAKHLGKGNFMSVLKAVVLGIPLPLCSCGVIPSAMALKKKGASRGAVVSFLIATPITGVDSIFATVSLLGIFFAIARVISAGLTAFIAGILTNIFVPGHGVREVPVKIDCKDCSVGVCERHRKKSKLAELIHYAFVELLSDVWKWFVLGIIIAGAISYLIPTEFVEKYLGNTWISMFLMMLIGIPMYVCSTGSIPIAAALMMKGMSPGAGLVFLLAGPATNAVTVTVVAKELGLIATILYVGSIAVVSIVCGFALNYIWGYMDVVLPSVMEQMNMIPMWVTHASSIVLGIMILFAAFKGLKRG